MYNGVVVDVLYNGSWVSLPTPTNVEYGRHNIWSKNTGRTASQKMVGDIIARKRDFKFTWDKLMFSELELIDRILNAKPFFKMRVFDPHKFSSTLELTVYVESDQSVTINSITSTGYRYSSISRTLVEQ